MLLVHWLKKFQNLSFDECLDWIISFRPSSSSRTVRVGKYMYVISVDGAVTKGWGGEQGFPLANYEDHP